LLTKLTLAKLFFITQLFSRHQAISENAIGSDFTMSLLFEMERQYPLQVSSVVPAAVLRTRKLLLQRKSTRAEEEGVGGHSSATEQQRGHSDGAESS
jgi:hypothetical protein